MRGVCPTQGSFGIQTTGTLSLLFSTAAGNWIAGVNFQALQIFPKYHISLHARWIPRGFNVIADFIDNLVNFDDYAINDFVFRVLMTTGDRIPSSGSPV